MICILATTGSRHEGVIALGSPVPNVTWSKTTEKQGKASELPSGALPLAEFGGCTCSAIELWQEGAAVVAAAEFVVGVNSLTPR